MCHSLCRKQSGSYLLLSVLDFHSQDWLRTRLEEHREQRPAFCLHINIIPKESNQAALIAMLPLSRNPTPQVLH